VLRGQRRLLLVVVVMAVMVATALRPLLTALLQLTGALVLLLLLLLLLEVGLASLGRVPTVPPGVLLVHELLLLLLEGFCLGVEPECRGRQQPAA
jgi:hypothetical protein